MRACDAALRRTLATVISIGGGGAVCSAAVTAGGFGLSSSQVHFFKGFGVVKALGIAALAAVVGLGCGWWSHRSRYGGVAEFGPFTTDQGAARPVSLAKRRESSGEAAKLEVVDAEEHDFGVMEPGSEGTHTFVVRNVGTAPLELEIVGSTCKCTVGTLEDPSIAPGGQTEIKLTWVGKSDTEMFGQSATLKTNDPTRPELSLKIRGRVISTMTMVPRNFTFGEVDSGETINLQSVIYSFSKTPIAAVEQVFSDPLMNSLASFDVQEVSPSELDDPSFAAATQAFKLNIDIRPGLPQGAIRENFSFGFVPHSAVDEQGDYDRDALSLFSAEITGKIVGPITLVESRKLISVESGYIFTMDSTDPATAKPERVNIMLRGPARDRISLKVGEVEPAGILHAELGEPIGRSNTVLVPLKLWIDPQAGPIERMGRGASDYGIVWIKSDDPEVSPLRLRVRFAVPK